MFRLYAAAAVLMLVCAVTAVCFFTNTRAADEITCELELAYSYAKADRPDSAEEHIERAQGLIIEKRKMIYMFISHNKLDDVSQEIAKAYECISGKDKDAFLVYCRSAMALTVDLREMELPLLYNLL